MAFCGADIENMTAIEDFVEEVARRASFVLSKPKARTEIFSINELPFQLIAAEQTPDEWLGRAFVKEPQGSASIASHSHRLAVWDGTDLTALPPVRPWGPTAHEPLGVVASYSNDAIRCAFDIHTSSLIVHNLAQNCSYVWFPNIVQLPAWAKASPFRIILSWICNQHRMQIVHSAAVAFDGRAVLLAGAGGSGKSTTALACALAGLGYLGDDYCAVEPAAGRVHMVYRTAKGNRATLDMLPSLAGWLTNRDRISREKGVMFLNESNVELVRSAELSAILLPRVTAEPMTTLYPATRDDAIKAVLPSTIGGLMGGTSVTPRLIMELVSSVPAFHLDLGTDLDAVTDTIASRLMVA